MHDDDRALEDLLPGDMSKRAADAASTALRLVAPRYQQEVRQFLI